MSTTYGIEFAIGISADVDNIENRLDALYSSLATNFPIVSVDLAWNGEKGSLTALLGVENPDGLDAESFVVGVASDAFTRGLEDAGLVEASDEIRQAPSARVLEFA